MNRFMRIMGLLLVAFYSLAMVHCDIETLPGFQFLACCQHQDAAPHQDIDCDMDGCSVVETGHYRIEEQPALAAVVCLLPLALIEVPQPFSSDLTPVPDSPPDWQSSWQFVLRTALPVRAPSLA